MNWGTGLVRLGALVSIVFLAAIPIEAGPSLYETTRGNVDAMTQRSAWDEANLPPGQVIASGDLMVSRIGRTELLAAGAMVSVLAGLALAGWVVSGFRRTQS